MKTAILIGATGLVGSKLLSILLQSSDYSQVVLFNRSRVEVEHPKLEQHLIDFNKISDYSDYIKGNDFYCCIGTTIKKAKTKDRFVQIDYEYPLTFAQLAKNNGVEKFLLVSSIGANAQSSNYYLNTKGRLEEKLKELNFNSTYIVRPSFLKGNRKEFRLGEKIGGIFFSVFSFLFIGKLKKYKPVESGKVAQAMYTFSKKKESGYFIVESNEIEKTTN